MRAVRNFLAVFLATGFGSGYAPKAPGTAGSLVAIPLIWATKILLPQSWVLSLIVLAIVYAIGMWSTHQTELLWQSHDDGRIVIDEIAGMFTALIWFPWSMPTAAAGFLLFRILDIWKPGPIGTIDEEWPGAFGTFFDDVLAGGVAAGLIFASSFLF